jgi:D-3-phosphoglycerate dehydrogenase
MKELKIYSTAEYCEEEFKPLYDIAEVVLDGWAIGEPNIHEDDLAKRVCDADIIITSYDSISRKVIDAAPKLKLIACTRATPVNVDIKAAAERGIPVLYTPGRNSDATAEMTMGLMLSVARKIPMAHCALRAGEYTRSADRRRETIDGLGKDVFWGVDSESPYMVFKGVELKGKTLGIFGFGSIGRRVGRLARAFGMQLLVYDPYVSDISIEEVGVRKADEVDDLMRESDFITFHMKVTPDTTGIIGKEQIALMKPSAFLINASRGAVLDENAVIEALREKRIAGAAFDVYAEEPIEEGHPLVTEFDNVVATPHIAGATNEAIVNHTRQIVSDILRFVDGKNLMYRYSGQS